MRWPQISMRKRTTGYLKELPEVFAVNDVQVQDKWTKLAFEVDGIIVKAVAENSLNPQDIEKAVKTNLLPKLFAACRGSVLE